MSPPPLFPSLVRRLATFAVAAAVGVLATGTADAQSRNRIVVGTTADVVNFNPLVGNSRSDTWVTNLMYPRLMQMTADGKKEAFVARDWGYSTDGKTARMTIRGDLKWSDGKPFTGDDVVFTITAIKKERLGTVAGLIPAFETARAVSPTEIEFTLSRPDGSFLTNIGFWMPIVPAHVFGQAEKVAEFANDKDWVAAGPFRMTRFDRGQRYVLERVDPYPMAPGGKAVVEQVEFRVFPDVNAQALALRNGDLDVIANALPPAVSRTLQSDQRIRLVTIPALGWAHMQYNTKRPNLDKVEVRQALAHAVDYEAIRRVVLQGQARTTRSSVVSPVLSFWHDPSMEEYAFDPALSRKLLEQAGFKDANGDGLYDGLSFALLYDQADPLIANWAQLVRDSSRRAGIDIRLTGLERNTYAARARARDFDIYAGSWSIMDEPPAYLGLVFRSNGFINYGQVESPEMEALLDKAQTALTPEEAKTYVSQIARLARDRVYDNVLYVQDYQFAYNAQRWTGLVPQPSDLLALINPLSLASVRPAN